MTMSDAGPGAGRVTPGTVTCVVAHSPPVTVVHVAGVLTLATASAVRAGVLKGLATAPAAVILDVAGLAVGDEAAVTVFAAVARHAAAWPAIPVLLCAPRPDLADALARLGVDRHVTVYPRVAEARAHSERRALPLQLHDRLPPVLSSVPAARALAADACRQWQLPDLTDSVGLVMTELAANAVRHAGTAFEVIVTRGRWHLHLAVRDDAASPPRRGGPDDEIASGGRGLLIVEALADHWGYTPTGDGKVTWATFRTARRSPSRPDAR